MSGCSIRAFFTIGIVTGLLAACGGDDGGPGGPVRSFRMGFSAIPARPDTALLVPTLELWTQRADAGLVQLSIPWDVLLADTAAATEVRLVRLPLVDYYRAKGLAAVVALDVTNGLDRSAEDPVLVRLGRSITDTMVQRLYREYVSAVDSILEPAYLSLAAETNLVRLAAPDSVYDAVVTMTNVAARHEHALGTSAKLMVSVQVEVAWGRLQGGTTYVGIDQDRSDFPFLDALGLSSYPYLASFSEPDSIPLNYYSRLTESAPLPLVVLEGGWSSVSVGGAVSSPAQQAEYLRRQAAVLGSAHAAALFQITFTDLDLSGWPGQPTGLEPFAHLGLVDSALTPKPALADWDSVFARPYRP
jgi:hypothetical protein